MYERLGSSVSSKKFWKAISTNLLFPFGYKFLSILASQINNTWCIHYKQPVYLAGNENIRWEERLCGIESPA